MSSNTNFKELINGYVKLIKSKIKTDNIQFLKKHHPLEYEEELSKFVPTFKNEYPFLFKMIINNDDLSMLDIFLDNIEDIDNGKKTLNIARNDLGQLLHDKYVNK
jgi:hypothetical protein